MVTCEMAEVVKLILVLYLIYRNSPAEGADEVLTDTNTLFPGVGTDGECDEAVMETGLYEVLRTAMFSLTGVPGALFSVILKV
jgi:hypothetical protein